MSNPALFTDSVRPHPKWPMMCVVENRPAHSTDKAAREWLTRIGMLDNLYRLWKCDHCQHWHHECFPIEASGASSGKSTRKWQFLDRKEAA